MCHRRLWRCRRWCECRHIAKRPRRGNIGRAAALGRMCTLDQLKAPESDSTENVPIRTSQIASYRDEGELRAMRFAMRISLAFGVLMLVGKMAAYIMTGSAAILSDAAESVIHVVAVAFAAFSLRLSTKPAKPGFLYGYERITFFSAGFEGAMIVLAAIFILYAAIEKWVRGLQLENLKAGTLWLLAAGVLNAGLGWYLIRMGRRTNLTLPSECVSLNRPGFEDLIHPRHRRGGGNVGIGFIDFQGLWEGRKTAPSFSGFPTNRHFHGLLRSPRTLRRRSSP